MKTLFVFSKGNRKTGPVVGGFHGESREKSKESCEGCPYLEDKSCYAHFGTPSFGHLSMIRARGKGKDYSFGAAVQNATSKKGEMKARAVRLGEIGEPSAMNKKEFQASRKFADDSGIPLLCYTHFWRKGAKGAWLKGESMASVGTLGEVDEAVAEGWRAAIVVPADTKDRVLRTPKGEKIVICPHQTKGIQCADCGLCDGRKNAAHIAFLKH